EIVSHLRLFRRFLENLYLRDEPPLVPAVAWQGFPEQGHSIASFCAWDGQELLAKIAGSFAVVPLNILSADIYTRGDNVVLDIFRVCDTRFRAVTDKRDKALVETTLRAALTDEHFDFAPLLELARRRIAGRSRHGLDFPRSEEHTSELQSRENIVCRLLLEKKKQSSSSSRPRSGRACRSATCSHARNRRPRRTT